jgi:hypothetical protein
MVPSYRKLLSIILFLLLEYNSTVFCQEDWHFVDETALRLPDTTTSADDLDGGDIDGSGSISILVGQSRNIAHNLPGVAQLFINNGIGYFGLADSSIFPQRNDESSYVMLLDIDADLDLDAFVVNYSYLTDYVALNDGNGNFQIDWSRLPQDSAVALFGDFADIDADGDIDVCLLGNNEQRFSHRLWINNGLGYFHDEIARLPGLNSLYRYIGFADINGDLAPDIVAVYYDGNESHPTIFINDGIGNFSDESSLRLPPTEPFCRTATLVDIDGDTDFDIVLSYSERLGFLINSGNGFFIDESPNRGPIYEIFPYVLKAYDVDNDNDQDLILGTAGIQADRIFINDGTGYFTDATNLKWPDQENSTYDLFIGDLDGDGDGDIFRVGWAYCRNSIFINTLNVSDSVPPRIMNQTIYSQIDTAEGPYPVKLIAQDGNAIPTQLSAYVFYSLDGRSYNSVSLHYTGAYTYYGELPAIDSGQTVLYYYSTTDQWQNTTYFPLNAPESVYTFTYLPGYVGIEVNDPQNPDKFSLSAYPNPFNSATTLTLSGIDSAEIEIYDIAGRKITTLQATHGRALWDASGVSSGVYFARVAGEKANTIKLILLK